MKNADDMLKEIMKTVDTNRDGKIQYEGTATPWWGRPRWADITTCQSKH